ncbi:hypothetical protein HYW42_00520 [Candidatus Daviesbacteria bacterium]|nr:hypothetical protein [Candidatus Daviesbacteria bacterium]
MTRNVTIVVIILVLVVIAGYLVWLRGRFQPPVSPQVNQEVEVTPTPTAMGVIEASPSATATSSARESTPSSRRR